MINLLEIVLCAISVFAGCCAGGATKANGSERKVKSEVSVIIVGSGAAGIAAAARLYENNITNVIILEAENRIGGRIHSVKFEDSIIDLGGEWCVGRNGNAVYELANSLNLLEPDSYNNFAYYHSSQKELDQEFVQKIQNIFLNIYDEPKNGVKFSLGEYLVHRFNVTIMKEYGRNVTLINQLLDLFNSMVLSEEGSFSWFDVSADNDFEDFEGRVNMGWKGRGYRTILDVLSKRYPDPSNELPVYKSVVFNKEVVMVTLGEEGSDVVCSDNTTYTANHVIWTPSLGVLKKRHEYLFQSALPIEKVNAIKSLGIGAVGKIFYYFSEKWWPDHVDLFSFIWSEQDAQNAWKEFPYGYENQGRSWLLDLRMITTNRYRPNILLAWVCGNAVPSIEKLADDVIISGTMFLFHKFLGHQFHNITWPQKIIREKWYSNDHFRGTYSYDTLESRAEGVSQRDILAKPLKSAVGKPVVLFAGEATNRIHYGTVHGAIETGRREADQIINYYK